MKKEHDENAKKYGMVIDLDKCTGCGACMVACMAENNVPFKEDETDRLKSITWMRVYKITNGKSYPDTEICYIPRPCMHCEGTGHGAPCTSVCPATATDYSHETGIVSQIYTRCFGCRYCMAACPYHARYFNWWDPVWPEGMERYLSPNVSPRMRGVVEKCSFCFHRYQLAKDKALTEGRKELEEHEYQTACTQACPAGAITFGDLNNPEHAVHQMVQPDSHHGGRPKNPNAFRLLERLQTNPKVYYLTSRKWVKQQGDNYLEKELKTMR
ncbi:MAG: 4Fe-4S dicluster domain-containing protein [Desulfobacterales bacterium]|nr:4Fe-4S dicluster domain-containing protein [Desulfobacterales bacterium]MDD4071123.1 4Fe-4S dicluster domain-containing protein [Desulfobacterales bacterium]MDD4393534.1 4Fe-4S dicluster domain-containing protein [Desulfobacterales bacterium]